MNTSETEGFVYVRDGAVLATLIDRIDSAARIAVDTEADSLHNYFEKVCLIQLSIDGAHYLVDPLAGLELRGFLEALGGQAVDFSRRRLRSAHTAGFDRLPPER